MMGEVRHTVYELKFREPIQTAKVRILKRRGFLFGVEIDGKEFVSEAALMPRFGTEQFEQAERVVQGETTNFMSAPATLFGLDCIRWASAQNFRGELHLPVATLLRETTNLAAGQEAERAVRAGFTSAKLKVGVLPYPEQADLIWTICHMAPKLRLRLDANLSVHEFLLRCLCEALPKEAIEWIEDPLRAGEDWEKLRRQVGIPLASDEAFSPAQLKQSDSWEKFDVLVVKPERFGPIAELEQVCARARMEGKKIVFSSMYESGVGLAHIAALAREYGSPDVAHGLGTSDVFEEDTLCEPLSIRDGKLHVPPLDDLASLLRPEWRERLGFASA